MPENETVLYLPTQHVEVDLSCPYRLMPGKVAVRMDPERTQEGSILIPETVSGRLRPDSGTVIGVGPAKRLQSSHVGQPITLSVGDRVLVRAYDGMWIDDVRFYGGAHDNGEFVSVQWWDQIVAVWHEGEWWPTGGNLKIRRIRQESDVLTSQPVYSQTAEVLARGDYVHDLVVGMTVTYRLDQTDDLLTFAFGGHEDEAIIPASCIQAVVS
jgi:co-chaperonin GroES (HSP10)